MPAPDFDAAIRYALDRLRAELPPSLTYHNLWHTQEDVMPAVQRLAEACGLDKDQQLLLAVAAAFHDLGFICQYGDHEQAGVHLAAAMLPQFGFGQEAITTIAGLILATRLASQPESLLQAVLADADLDVLGRDDFLARSQALWQEVSTHLDCLPRPVWLQEQRAFLQAHRYYTAAARSLRDAGKQRNIQLLDAVIRREHDDLAG
jgi:uncharacterized protein